MNVRDEVAAGRDVRVIPLAREIGVVPATIYTQLKRGDHPFRKLGCLVIVPNAVARKYLGMDEQVAA